MKKMVIWTAICLSVDTQRGQKSLSVSTSAGEKDAYEWSMSSHRLVWMLKPDNNTSVNSGCRSDHVWALKRLECDGGALEEGGVGACLAFRTINPPIRHLCCSDKSLTAVNLAHLDPFCCFVVCFSLFPELLKWGLIAWNPSANSNINDKCFWHQSKSGNFLLVPSLSISVQQ